MAIFLSTEDEGLRCPVCKQRAMSRAEKFNSGCSKRHPCAHCGVPVRVSCTSTLVLLSPVAIWVTGLVLIDPPLVVWIASYAGFAGWFFIYRRYWARIPLVAADGPSRRDP